MSFFLLFLRGCRINKKLEAYKREKENAIRISDGLKPNYTLCDRLHHKCFRCRRRIQHWFAKTCLPDPKNPLRRFWVNLKTDETLENYLGKSILGFLGGILLTYVFFIAFILQMRFSVTAATLWCTLFGIILTLGLAFSKKVRIVVFLMLPQFFSKRGRQALMAYAFVLVLTGPAKNALRNTEIMSESLACGQEQLKQAARQIIDAIKKPFVAIKDAFKKVMKFIKVIVKKIKAILLAIKRIVVNILKVIKSVFQWLGSIFNICSKKVGTPFQRCKRVFDNSVTDCQAKLGPLFSWACSIAYVTGLICNTLRVLDLLCMFLDFINDSIFGVVKKKIKDFVRHIRNIFYVSVEFKHSYSFETQQNVSMKEIAAGMLAEIRQRTEWVLTLFDVMSLVMSSVFLLLLFKVIQYRLKFLTKDRFDNYFITTDFREIDMRRAKSDLETVLPLNRRERNKYITISSVRLVKAERTKLVKSFLFLFSTTFKMGIIMAADYGLYWTLDLIRTHGALQTSVQAPQVVEIKVQGDGVLADLYRSVDKAFKPLGIKMDIDTVPCLPQPIPPDFMRYIQIGTTVLLCYLLAVLEPYGLRFRNKIMRYYYPDRAKQRAVWLYNHILRTRGSFLKYARRQLRRNFGKNKDGAIEYVSIMDRIRAMCPLLDRLLGKRKQQMCILCGRVVREGSKNPLVKCPTPNCPGLFCTSCYADLMNICTICKKPIEYGDLSDESLEHDSSDDEPKKDSKDDNDKEPDPQNEGGFSSDLSYGYQDDNGNDPNSHKPPLEKRPPFKDVEEQTEHHPVSTQIFNASFDPSSQDDIQEIYRRVKRKKKRLKKKLSRFTYVMGILQPKKSKKREFESESEKLLSGGDYISETNFSSTDSESSEFEKVSSCCSQQYEGSIDSSGILQAQDKIRTWSQPYISPRSSDKLKKMKSFPTLKTPFNIRYTETSELSKDFQVQYMTEEFPSSSEAVRSRKTEVIEESYDDVTGQQSRSIIHTATDRGVLQSMPTREPLQQENSAFPSHSSKTVINESSEFESESLTSSRTSYPRFSNLSDSSTSKTERTSSTSEKDVTSTTSGKGATSTSEKTTLSSQTEETSGKHMSTSEIDETITSSSRREITSEQKDRSSSTSGKIKVRSSPTVNRNQGIHDAKKNIVQRSFTDTALKTKREVLEKSTSASAKERNTTKRNHGNLKNVSTVKSSRTQRDYILSDRESLASLLGSEEDESGSWSEMSTESLPSGHEMKLYKSKLPKAESSLSSQILESLKKLVNWKSKDKFEEETRSNENVKVLTIEAGKISDRDSSQKETSKEKISKSETTEVESISSIEGDGYSSRSKDTRSSASTSITSHEEEEDIVDIEQKLLLQGSNIEIKSSKPNDFLDSRQTSKVVNVHDIEIQNLGDISIPNISTHPKCSNFTFPLISPPPPPPPPPPASMLVASTTDISETSQELPWRDKILQTETSEDNETKETSNSDHRVQFQRSDESDHELSSQCSKHTPVPGRRPLYDFDTLSYQGHRSYFNLIRELEDNLKRRKARKGMQYDRTSPDLIQSGMKRLEKQPQRIILQQNLPAIRSLRRTLTPDIVPKQSNTPPAFHRAILTSERERQRVQVEQPSLPQSRSHTACKCPQPAAQSLPYAELQDSVSRVQRKYKPQSWSESQQEASTSGINFPRKKLKVTEHQDPANHSTEERRSISPRIKKARALFENVTTSSEQKQSTSTKTSGLRRHEEQTEGPEALSQLLRESKQLKQQKLHSISSSPQDDRKTYPEHNRQPRYLREPQPEISLHQARSGLNVEPVRAPTMRNTSNQESYAQQFHSAHLNLRGTRAQYSLKLPGQNYIDTHMIEVQEQQEEGKQCYHSLQAKDFSQSERGSSLTNIDDEQNHRTQAKPLNIWDQQSSVEILQPQFQTPQQTGLQLLIPTVRQVPEKIKMLRKKDDSHNQQYQQTEELIYRSNLNQTLHTGVNRDMQEVKSISEPAIPLTDSTSLGEFNNKEFARTGRRHTKAKSQTVIKRPAGYYHQFGPISEEDEENADKDKSS